MKLLLVTILFIFSSLFANAKEYSAVKVIDIQGTIWGMDFISEDKLILTNKNGNIFLYHFKTKSLNKIYEVSDVFNVGQGGLFDVKVSPNFKDDKTIFFTYSKNINFKGATTLAKAKFENDELKFFQDILVTKSISNENVHYGSRITFDGNGHIFFSVGERGVRENAQNLTNHAGSILRLNLDGTVPKDNPFVNDRNKLDEIYSYGHRNPQGIFFDKINNRLWEVEHGPKGGDEVNLIEASKNYGWPIISYGKEYWSQKPVGKKEKKGMIQAKKYYVPSIATSSIIYYSGNEYKDLKNKLIVSALKLRHLNILSVDKNGNIIKEERIFEKLGDRIRNIVQSPKGLLYFSTDKGKIYLIKED